MSLPDLSLCSLSHKDESSKVDPWEEGKCAFSVANRPIGNAPNGYESTTDAVY